MVVLFTSDLISYLLGRPLVPDVMVGLYRTAWLPGFAFALVVLAPIAEESLFRGFLYRGIADSRAGPIAAVIVSCDCVGHIARSVRLVRRCHDCRSWDSISAWCVIGPARCI